MTSILYATFCLFCTNLFQWVVGSTSKYLLITKILKITKQNALGVFYKKITKREEVGTTYISSLFSACTSVQCLQSFKIMYFDPSSRKQDIFFHITTTEKCPRRILVFFCDHFFMSESWLAISFRVSVWKVKMYHEKKWRKLVYVPIQKIISWIGMYIGDEQ